jgi:hypothetical protein
VPPTAEGADGDLISANPAFASVFKVMTSKLREFCAHAPAVAPLSYVVTTREQHQPSQPLPAALRGHSVGPP